MSVVECPPKNDLDGTDYTILFTGRVPAISESFSMDREGLQIQITKAARHSRNSTMEMKAVIKLPPVREYMHHYRTYASEIRFISKVHRIVRKELFHTWTTSFHNNSGYRIVLTRNRQLNPLAGNEITVRDGSCTAMATQRTLVIDCRMHGLGLLDPSIFLQLSDSSDTADSSASSGEWDGVQPDPVYDDM